jgi:hypothetical protein
MQHGLRPLTIALELQDVYLPAPVHGPGEYRTTGNLNHTAASGFHLSPPATRRSQRKDYRQKYVKNVWPSTELAAVSAASRGKKSQRCHKAFKFQSAANNTKQRGSSENAGSCTTSTSFTRNADASELDAVAIGAPGCMRCSGDLIYPCSTSSVQKIPNPQASTLRSTNNAFPRPVLLRVGLKNSSHFASVEVIRFAHLPMRWSVAGFTAEAIDLGWI